MKYYALIFVSVLFICCMSSADAAMPQSVYWQLILKYTENGVTLERMSRMAPLAKKVRSPGVAGRPVSLPYTVSWQDMAGKTLTSSAVDIPLGIRVPPDSTDKPFVLPDTGYCVIRAIGPADLTDVSRLTLERNAAILRDNRINIPRSFDHELIALPVNSTTANDIPAVLAEGPTGVRKAVDTGDDGNRLVMVVIGDGYTAPNLAADDFSNDVLTLVAAFNSTPPWNLFLEGSSVYAIDVESNEQGADYADASPDTGGTTKDTYFNSAFWCSDIERLLCITGDGYSKAYAAADAYVGVGVWDEIIVLVNSTKYGGSGGSIAVSSVNSAAPGVILHEFGHSFGYLADEYDYGNSGPYTGSDPSNPNVDIHTNYVNIKWNVWIEDGTPLPTPDSATYDNTVGAFEGARYHTTGIYRPWRCCMMRALSCGFCPVCTEAMSLEYFDMVSLADDSTPSPGSVVNSVDSNAIIRIDPLPVAGLAYTWKADGIVQSSATGPVFTCNAGMFSAHTGTVEATVSFPTAQIRKTTVSETYRWTIIVPEPTVLLPVMVVCMYLRRRSGFRQV